MGSILLLALALVLAAVSRVDALIQLFPSRVFRSRLQGLSMNSGAVYPTVEVYSTPADVSTALCQNIAEAAKAEIAAKGKFFIAVPGGSVLKQLSGLKAVVGVDWSKVFLFYVNHKCISNSDPSATHFKAKSLFLDSVQIPTENVASLIEGLQAKGHDTDAHEYESKMRSLLPLANGLPVFDYMLIGAGKDGHIGSLYPDRKEVLSPSSGQWVLSVDKKSPASITLSLPVMNNAKSVRVVLMGEDKAEAALAGVTKTKAPIAFPVCGLRSEGTVWMVDAPCASLLLSKVDCVRK